MAADDDLAVVVGDLNESEAKVSLPLQVVLGERSHSSVKTKQPLTTIPNWSMSVLNLSPAARTGGRRCPCRPCCRPRPARRAPKRCA